MGFLDSIFGKKVEKRKKEAYDLGRENSNFAIPRLAKLLEDNSPEVRKVAIGSLEQHWPTGNGTAIFILTNSLKDDDHYVRKISALAIGEYMTRTTDNSAYDLGKTTLLRLLESENDNDVINYATISLGNIDDSTVIEPMINRLTKRDKEIIKTAYDAIDNLNPTGIRNDMKNKLETLL